jgi:hypothetical protein
MAANLKPRDPNYQDFFLLSPEVPSVSCPSWSSITSRWHVRKPTATYVLGVFVFLFFVVSGV